MLDSYLASRKLQPRSQTPGRERWDALVILRNALFAREMERLVRSVKGIEHVSASPVTGRILVCYIPEQLEGEVGSILHDALAIIEAKTTNREAEVLDAEGVSSAKARSSKKVPGGKQLYQLVSSVGDLKKRNRALFFSGVSSFFYLISPLPLTGIITTALGRPSSYLKSLGFTSAFSQIGFYSGLYALFKGIAIVSDNYRKKLWREYGNRVELELRARAFEHIEKMDMRDLEDQSTGKLMNLIVDDTGKIKRFIEETPYAVIQKVSTFGVVSGFLFLISPALGLISLAPLPIIYYRSRRYNKEMAARYAAQSEATDYLNHLLANDLSGLPTIKSFTSEERELKRISLASEDLYDQTMKSKSLSAYYADTTHAITSTSMLVTLVFGAKLVIDGIYPFKLFMIQCFLMPKFMVTMENLDRDYDQYQSAVSAAIRLNRLLQVQHQITSGQRLLVKDQVRGEIALDKISFRYHADHPILSNVDVTIPANTTVAFVGPTGAGKTTLIKLLLRFYDVTEGRILIDNIDLRELDLHALRSVVGLVSQDIYLFSGTVAENIGYGRPGAGIEELIAAAESAEAREFIEKLPMGFNTVIGERGQKLSGGQRQRLSIARAILKDPPILILDEATSAVDNETEAAIQRSINRISVNRTTILIAHRLSTVRNADRIHFMSDGHIIETGTHDELLRLDGAYAALWQIQTGNVIDYETEQPLFLGQ